MYQTTKKERLLYGLYFFGQNILWAFAGLVSTFLLDIGLDAKVASAILLGPKIWDAVNDTLFGYVIDKVNWKNKQKFMPWIKIGTACIAVTVILMYAIPASLNNPSLKICWFIAAYILFDAAYTMLDAPMYAMPTAMTTNIQERTSLLSSNRFWGILGGVVGYVLIPLIRPKSGWLAGAVIFSLVGLFFMAPFLFVGRERNTEHKEASEKEYSVSEMLDYLKTNSYLILSLMILFIVGACSIESSLSLIVARNCFGNESMATIITVIVMLPTMFIALAIPPLTRKFDKSQVLLAGLIAGFIGGVGMLITGYDNFVLAIIMMALKGAGNAIFMVISYMLIADSVEYGTYKSGTRATGISFSLQTFTSKLKNAVIGSISLFALGIFGYDSSLPENVVQTPEVVKGIWKVFSGVPALGYLIAIVLMVRFYKLRDRDVEAMARYNNGEEIDSDVMKRLEERYGRAEK